jgi:hypothetical protein
MLDPTPQECQNSQIETQISTVVIRDQQLAAALEPKDFKNNAKQLHQTYNCSAASKQPHIDPGSTSQRDQNTHPLAGQPPTPPPYLPSMAPSFDHLREADLDDDDFDEDELDFSDLREKYEVQLDQGYDSFIVIDGLPEVTADQKPKLVKFLMKKLNAVGKTREDLIYMPLDEDGKSLRYATEFDPPVPVGRG